MNKSNLKITFHNPNSEADTANFFVKEIAKNLSEKIIQEQNTNLISQQKEAITDHIA